MKRITIMMFVATLLAVGLLARPATADGRGSDTQQLQLVEATIDQLQDSIRTELITPEQLVRMYLARIAAYDKAGPAVNAYLFLNPNADAQARQLSEDDGGGDGEGDQGGRRPLFGIPVLLKDNVDTADMPTTAG